MELDAIAGFELSLGKEARQGLTQILRDHERRLLRVPFRAAESGTIDANGNLSMEVFECPEGQFFYITSLIQLLDGIDPHNPYSTANGWFAYYYGPGNNPANVIDLGPSVAGGTIFPNRNTYPMETDPILKGGDQLWFRLVNCASIAGQNVTAIAAGVFGEAR